MDCGMASETIFPIQLEQLVPKKPSSKMEIEVRLNPSRSTPQKTSTNSEIVEQISKITNKGNP